MSVRNCAELGENLQKIMQYLMADRELACLLYYTDKDPCNNLHTTPTTAQLYEKLVKILPRVTEDETGKSIIVLKVDNGIGLKENGEFKRISISIDVYVPFTQWFIKDTNLRPFAIIGRIQKLLCGLTINGLGKLDGGDFEINFLSDEASCHTVRFDLISYA